MYWYKPKNLLVALGVGGVTLLLLGNGCKPGNTDTNPALKYFDIKGYFESEAIRLTKQNRPVLKMITYNGKKEDKMVTITDWKRELDFFESSDINKPALKDSYSIVESEDAVIYRAKNRDVKMQEMIVKKANKKVKWILIYNFKKNLLYQTTEKLSYFPDSLYLIEKQQRVRLLGKNFYRIKGFFRN